MTRPDKPHNSQRGHFAYHLYDEMRKNTNIWVLTGDLGYKMFDAIRDDYPDRFINCGASELSMMAMAVGLAQEGKIPIVYSISPFIVYRPFEVIRNYINYEQTPVIIVGGGQDKDYEHDGMSHWAHDVPEFMAHFENIQSYYPEEKEEIETILSECIEGGKPCFVNLKR